MPTFKILFLRSKSSIGNKTILKTSGAIKEKGWGKLVEFFLSIIWPLNITQCTM
jgi:hypothetical protein